MKWKRRLASHLIASHSVWQKTMMKSVLVSLKMMRRLVLLFVQIVSDLVPNPFVL
jgi:hypothetical protein